MSLVKDIIDKFKLSIASQYCLKLTNKYYYDLIQIEKYDDISCSAASDGNLWLLK
jgi:hypothetical protein